MVTTSAPVMAEVQIFHKETLTNPTDNIHNVGDFCCCYYNSEKNTDVKKNTVILEQYYQTGIADFAAVARP